MALPELYQEKEFQKQTFDRNSEFMKRNPNLTARGTRKFNRYWNSDQRLEDEKAFNAAQDAAEVAHIEAEAKKRADSWDARIAALREQNATRGEAALKNINASLAAKPAIPTPKPEPEPKPASNPVAKTLIQRSEAEWNRIASETTNGPVLPSASTPSPIQTPTTPTTKVETPKFSLNAFASTNNLTDFRNFNGKRVVRYDPLGRGDWFIDEDGKTYWANGIGTLGDHVESDYKKYIPEIQRRFDTLQGMITASYQKQGGTMNRINYFQQGGAAPQQDIKAQVTALVQAAMQGDQKATQQVNQIMEAAKAGDQQAMQIAQIMEQVVKEMQGQAVAAKYGAKLDYLQTLKCGGKAKAKKKEQGGKVCPVCEQKKQVNKHQYGGSFYNKWSDGDIRELQMFLSGRKGSNGNIYYEGDYSGVMDKALFDAIKAYQRDNGFTADGMWGYNTNQLHRVLDSDILKKGSYKPTHKTEQGNLIAYPTDFTYATMHDFSPAQIQKVVDYYSANPDLLYSDDMEHSKWRQVFHNSGKDGADFLNQMAGALTEEERAKIDPKKLTTQYKTDALVSKVNAGRNEAARQLLPALAVPTALATGIPVIASGSIPGIVGLATGVGGSVVGSKVGEKRGAKKGAKRKDEAYVDPVSERYGVASSVIDPKRRIQEGAEQGRTVGGLVGGITGSLTGTATAAAAEGGIWNNIGFARAAGNYQGKVTSPNSTMSVYGYDTPGPIKGVSRGQLFKEGLFAPRQFSDGTTRTGGVFGGKYVVNGKIHNPGTPISADEAAALSQAYNSPTSPLKINFGGAQGTGRGVKIGQMYSLNPSGVAAVGMGVAPMGMIATDAVRDTQPNHPVRQQRRADRKEERKEKRQERHKKLISRTAESTTD